MTTTLALLQTIALLCNARTEVTPKECQEYLYACVVVKVRDNRYATQELALASCISETKYDLYQYPGLMAGKKHKKRTKK